MEYTSKRKASTRWIVRIWGVVFTAVGISMLARLFAGKVKSLPVLFGAVAVVFLFVAYSYIKQSFDISGYDITYRVDDDALHLDTVRGKKTVEYSDITQVILRHPEKNMDYYMVQIVTPKENLVMHVEGHEHIARSIYAKLLEKTGLEGMEIRKGEKKHGK